jgi:hypothetical protein
MSGNPYHDAKGKFSTGQGAHANRREVQIKGAVRQPVDWAAAQRRAEAAKRNHYNDQMRASGRAASREQLARLNSTGSFYKPGPYDGK